MALWVSEEEDRERTVQYPARSDVYQGSNIPLD